VHVVGFIIRIYHDARSSECQTELRVVTVILKTPFYNMIFKIKQITSFTECKNVKTPTLQFGVNATIEFKNITTPSGNKGTLFS
jgi:hypothetical protein